MIHVSSGFYGVGNKEVHQMPGRAFDALKLILHITLVLFYIVHAPTMDCFNKQCRNDVCDCYLCQSTGRSVTRCFQRRKAIANNGVRCYRSQPGSSCSYEHSLPTIISRSRIRFQTCWQLITSTRLPPWRAHLNHRHVQIILWHASARWVSNWLLSW